MRISLIIGLLSAAPLLACGSDQSKVRDNAIALHQTASQDGVIDHTQRDNSEEFQETKDLEANGSDPIQAEEGDRRVPVEDLSFSKNGDYAVRLEVSGVLLASQPTGNEIIVTFYLTDGTPASEVQFDASAVVPWMYMPTAEHGNFGRDNHSLEWEAANAVRLKDVFFIMASHLVASDGSVSSFGRWVLKIEASVDGMLDSIEVEVPAVF